MRRSIILAIKSAMKTNIRVILFFRKKKKKCVEFQLIAFAK